MNGNRNNKVIGDIFSVYTAKQWHVFIGMWSILSNNITVDQSDLIQSKWFKYFTIVCLAKWKKVDANRTIISIQPYKQNYTVYRSNSMLTIYAPFAKQRTRAALVYSSVLYILHIQIRSHCAMWYMNFICSLKNDREYAQGIQMTCWWIIIWWMIIMDVNYFMCLDIWIST